MELWTAFFILLILGGVLFLIVKAMAQAGIKASIIATLIITASLCLLYGLYVGPVTGEISFAIFAFIGLCFAIVQVGKYLVNAGAVPKIATHLTLIGVTATVTYFVTGSPSFSANSSIVMFGVSGLSLVFNT